MKISEFHVLLAVILVLVAPLLSGLMVRKMVSMDVGERLNELEPVCSPSPSPCLPSDSG